MRIARKLIADKTAHTTHKPGVPYTLGLAAECIRAQLAIEYPVAKKTAKVAGRDLLFDAIVLACGCDLTSMTRNFAKMVATAKRDILEATPDVTPEEVQRRVKAYKAKYQGAACTPMALANHWPEFGQPNGRGTRGSKTDIYTEPPAGWRIIAVKLYPDATKWVTPHNFGTMAWLEVNDTIRRGILAKLYP